MNLPNKLTLSRLLVVLVIACMFYIFSNVAWNLYVILGLFVLASFTDFLDGRIARKNNLVTGFGKLMDPLADKMLVVTAIIILMNLGVIKYSWLLIIVLFREFFVLGIRLVALEENGECISAALLGKLKTLTQMVSLVLLLLYSALILSYDNTFTTVLYYFSIILFYISMVLLVVSGMEVFIKNRKVFKIK